MNLKIRELKVVLINYINGIDLPSEIKRMVIREIYEEISENANIAVSEELKQRENDMEKEESDEQSV